MVRMRGEVLELGDPLGAIDKEIRARRNRIALQNHGVRDIGASGVELRSICELTMHLSGRVREVELPVPEQGRPQGVDGDLAYIMDGRRHPGTSVDHHGERLFLIASSQEVVSDRSVDRPGLDGHRSMTHGSSAKVSFHGLHDLGCSRRLGHDQSVVIVRPRIVVLQQHKAPWKVNDFGGLRSGKAMCERQDAIEICRGHRTDSTP